MIVLVVFIIFSYGPHSDMGGGRHIVPLGGSWHFYLGPEKTQKRKESGLRNFCIPIFLIVVQDEPCKIPVTYLSERFSEIIFKKCVNDSFQREKPRRGKLSSEGRN